MVIVLVKYYCKDGMRMAFLEAIQSQGLDAASQKEEGNLRYSYSYDIEDENILVLTELWKDEAALALHGTMPHYQQLGELKKAYVDRTEVQRFVGQEL